MTNPKNLIYKTQTTGLFTLKEKRKNVLYENTYMVLRFLDYALSLY